MSNTIASIMRQATRKNGPLNILTFPTHERYESALCLTGHNFYAIRAPGVKDWVVNYANPPKNYYVLNGTMEDKQIPMDKEYDLIICHNRFAQFKFAHYISKTLHIPLICIEHTLPPPNWTAVQFNEFHSMEGDVNIFITTYSKKGWGYENDDKVLVIKHGVDTSEFKPGPRPGDARILSVVNDFANRDWCCGFNLWRGTTQELPITLVGDTPGFSEPAKDTAELIRFYQQHGIFYNTSLISPIPTVLLEAMSCGAAVVSTATCAIPEIIQNGQNGLISNNPQELRSMLETVLRDEGLRVHLGTNARKTIEEKYNITDFVKNWNNAFYSVDNYVRKG